jgi:hypothetical protein
MGVSRRNALIGIGALITGGGAILGTGAFTTVQAERTVNVETAGDASAFLALTSNNDDIVDDSGDTIEINLDGSSSSNADGLNQNALTRFENLVDVTNNGSQSVDTLTFEFEVTGTNANSDHEDAMKITQGSNTLGANGTDNFLSSSYADTTLGTGDSVSFGIEVDLLNSGISDISDDAEAVLTITAESA